MSHRVLFALLDLSILSESLHKYHRQCSFAPGFVRNTPPGHCYENSDPIVRLSGLKEKQKKLFYHVCFVPSFTDESLMIH